MVKERISVGWKNITSVTIKPVKEKKNLIANISWTAPNVELVNSNIFYEINVDNYKNIKVSTTNTDLSLGHNNIKFKIRTMYEIINDDEELIGIAKSDWSDIFSINGVRDEYCENIVKCKNILLNNPNSNVINNNSNKSSKQRYAQVIKEKNGARSYSGNYSRCGFSLGNIFR